MWSLGLIGMIFLTFVALYMKMRTDLSEITSTVKKIIHGNINHRIRLQTGNKSIQRLARHLNDLLDQYQHVLVKSKTNEEMRKKFISNMSHDLITPLTSLLGYIEVLKKDPDLSEQEKREYIDIIDKKVHFLYEFMEQFFQLSKLEAKDVALRIEKINLSQIVRQTLLFYYDEFVKMETEPVILIPEQDLFVLGDLQATKRILNNLISNHLKYGADGEQFGIQLREEDRQVWVDLWDNGRGIPEHELEHIFERLYTLERSRNKKLQGSGLGLTIVKQLVEYQNGKIMVNSIPYEKTIFSFSLPKPS
ncbi:sensor histidine kinase [Paenactinomyces guangxiensis]|uniref:histidine kinase n=1 Tax=Paenactinomyces guangxiensis TaxID=1490290 RepID=A0A7W1WSI1_9BACL|nr:sensor histidine kinase [Paenactinomyces guangxiensis]